MIIFRKLPLLAAITLLLISCSSGAPPDQKIPQRQEQLYIDARLNFAIKHPLAWLRKTPPVSSPEYRADTVTWEIRTASSQEVLGTMRLQRLTSKPPEQLRTQFGPAMQGISDLQSVKIADFDCPGVEKSLSLHAETQELGLLMFAYHELQYDYLLSFQVSLDKFNQMRPLFEDLAISFSELCAVE